MTNRLLLALAIRPCDCVGDGVGGIPKWSTRLGINKNRSHLSNFSLARRLNQIRQVVLTSQIYERVVNRVSDLKRSQYTHQPYDFQVPNASHLRERRIENDLSSTIE